MTRRKWFFSQTINQSLNNWVLFFSNECVAEKAKFKKWSLFPKKSKSRGVMEGAPLTQEGICQVYQLIEFLSKEPSKCTLLTSFYGL